LSAGIGSVVSRLMAQRNADSVLPEPVGARISVCSPRAMAGQPCTCGGVGSGKDVSNHARTAGENVSRTIAETVPTRCDRNSRQTARVELVVIVLALVLACAQPVPQVVRLLRTHSVEGVSSATTMLGVVVAVAWIAYGLARGLPTVYLLSFVFLAGYLVTATLLWQRGRRSGVGLAALLASGFVAVTAGLGWTALGLVLGAVAIAQFAPQVIEANRATDLSGLAPGTCVVWLLDGIVWGGYGLLVDDGPLLVYAVVMFGVGAGVLVPWFRWRTATLATA
jgi:uncharacterized protein with PQ loop repeat